MVQDGKYQRVHGIFKCVIVCLLSVAWYFAKINPVDAFFYLAQNLSLELVTLSTASRHVDTRYGHPKKSVQKHFFNFQNFT